MFVTRGYVEHAAIYAGNIEWYIQYFREVFGMEILEMEKQEDKLKQVWLHGGIQLTAFPDFKISEPQKQGITHIGLMVEDVRSAVDESHARGLQPVKGKENWVWLPDGVALEIKHGKGTSVADALKVHPR
jgi:predicted enzyme related to lactoylglutathione lyase